jgi:TPP-dependent pyruvate/acetoin dehydrogenase alpha subunit
VDDHLSSKSVVQRAAAYDIEAISVFGNDMVEVYNVVREAVNKVREGHGPFFVGAETYRLLGYSTYDRGGYQRDEDIDRWREQDPLIIAESFLVTAKIVTREEIPAMKEKAAREVKEAIEYAIAAPFPEPLSLPDDLFVGAGR